MTTALEGGEWSAARPGRTLPPGKIHSILQEPGWASGPVWAGGKSRPHRDLIPDCPARSLSLYRLSYPVHTHTHTHTHTHIYSLVLILLKQGIKLQFFIHQYFSFAQRISEQKMFPNKRVQTFPKFSLSLLAHSRNCEKRLFASSCFVRLSVRPFVCVPVGPHGTARLPLKKFL